MSAKVDLTWMQSVSIEVLASDGCVFLERGCNSEINITTLSAEEAITIGKALVAAGKKVSKNIAKDIKDCGK